MCFERNQLKLSSYFSLLLLLKMISNTRKQMITEKRAAETIEREETAKRRVAERAAKKKAADESKKRVYETRCGATKNPRTAEKSLSSPVSHGTLSASSTPVRETLDDLDNQSPVASTSKDNSEKSSDTTTDDTIILNTTLNNTVAVPQARNHSDLLFMFCADQTSSHLRREAVRATAGLANVLNELKSAVCTLKEGTPEQICRFTEAFEGMTYSSALTSATETGRICAQTEQKMLEVMTAKSQEERGDQSNDSEPNQSRNKKQTPNERTPADEAGVQYKSLFKLKEVDADIIVKPITEINRMMKGFYFQIVGAKKTPVGHAVWVQTREMFAEMKKRSTTHVTEKNTPLLDVFEVRHFIISDFALKTDRIPRNLLVNKFKLVKQQNSYLEVDIEKMTTFLYDNNRGWFCTPQDIRNIEIFNVKKETKAAYITLKLHVTQRTLDSFLAAKTTTIMLEDEPVTVYEEIPVLQCMKCCGFGHRSLACTAKSGKCRFCSISDSEDVEGHHPHYKCPHKNNKEKYRCVLCLEKAAFENKELEEPPVHCATSFACPLVKAELNRLRREAKTNRAK